MNLEQRPSMPRLIASETGVIATVTVAAIAVTGVLFATGIHLRKAPVVTQTTPVVTQAAPAVMQATSSVKRETRGADLDADQPFYDESAGKAIGLR